MPFVTVRKKKRIGKPRLVAQCDVSGLVSPALRFRLKFLYALQKVLARSRGISDMFRYAPCCHMLRVRGALRELERVTGLMEMAG